MTGTSDRPTGAVAGGDADGDEVGLDELFEVLADRRRRYALYRLRRANGEIPLPELIGGVLKWETGRGPEELPEKRRQRAHLDFYHTHVPLLSDHGLVSYSEAEELVGLDVDLEDWEPYLGLAREHDEIPSEDHDDGDATLETG